MKNFDDAKFVNDLLEIVWNSISLRTDYINVVVNLRTNIFSFILEKHAPTRNRRVFDKFCPLLTKDFKLMCKERDMLKQQAIRSRSESLMVSCRHMRNQINNLKGEFKREYFTNKIASCEGDLNNTWKTINNVLNEKSKTTNIMDLNIENEYKINPQKNKILISRY